MSTVAESPGRPAQTAGATMAVDGGEHGFAHECATTPRAGDGVDFGNYLIVQLEVHSHV